MSLPRHCVTIRKQVFVFFLLALACLSANAQNITLVGQNKPYPGTSYQYGDVWAESNTVCVGVFSPYSTGTNGVAIFDISTPSNPVFKANYFNANQFEQGTIRSNICYIASWTGSGGGLHILSITNPAAPVLIARIGNTTGTVTNGHDTVHTMFLERNFLYEADHHTPVVKIFDISNPALPVFKWNLTTTNTVRVHQITVVSNRLYTSGWGLSPSTAGKTDIWDVSNVGTQPPVYLGSISSGPKAHSSWPSDDNNLLVVCREIAGGDVGLYDISNPAAPVLLITISPTTMGLEADTPHNPVIMGNLLFLSWYQNGLQIFDITDRAKPVRIGSYDTFPTAETTLFQGNWGIYPRLGLNKLLVSDMQKGLLILDASAVLTGTNNYPPLLIKSPTNQTATSGTSVAFSATFTGSSLKYQWRFNGAIVSGATNSSYSIASVQPNNSGTYAVTANNTFGTVASSSASLNVVVPSGVPVITSQPQSISVYPENSATFSVAVTGNAPFDYRWRFNNSDISGATNNSFTQTNVQPEQVGNYSVMVSNSVGTVLSSNALLTLIDSPYISSVRTAPGGRAALISWSTSVSADAQVQFEVAGTVARGSASFSSSSSIDRNLSTNHTILLTGLSPDTIYNFQIVSAAGTNHYLSAIYQLRTAGNLILDNTNAVFSGSWTSNSASADKYGPDYRYAFSVTGSANATATYTPNLATPGNYNVYTWHPAGGNRSSDSHFLITYSGGTTNVRIDQKINGGVWLLLATNLPFAGGNAGFVRLSNDSSIAGNVVMADAIRFEYITAQDLPTTGTAPAWWQYYYFAGSVDPSLDPDGDGYTTAKEYVMGTAPTDANAHIQTAILPDAGNVNVTFSPFCNDRSYELLYRPDVAGSTWQSLPTGSLNPNEFGEVTLTTTSTNSNQGFYRVRVQMNTSGITGTRQLTPAKSRSFSAETPEVVCGTPNRPYVK
ncbi:MAG: hypothetical protein JWQ71_1089 [Pedosphaera sp.]|nr:hypothetical protein [Pedosphaera sp.]